MKTEKLQGYKLKPMKGAFEAKGSRKQTGGKDAVLHLHLF